MPAARSAAPPSPQLDEDGLLRFDSKWVVITDAQLPVMALLLERFERVVRWDAIVAAYSRGGHSPSRGAVRSAIARLGTRISSVGLGLYAVHGRGLLLSTRPDR